MAGFWRRGLALLIDVVLAGAICLLVLKVGIGSVSLSALPKSTLSGVDYLVDLILRHSSQFSPIALFVVLAFFAYFFLFQAVFAWTPGKRLLNMRVVDPQGRRIGPTRALLRTLGYAISVSFFMMGFLWAAFDLERRSLHDVLCGTYVIIGHPAARSAPAAVTQGTLQTATRARS
jgi:uncharacterized RDD family membrane protein YckC